MRYEEAIAAAPAGWTMFSAGDVDRLPPSVRLHALQDVPQGDVDALGAGDHEAGERVRRALFWTFVYHLRPELWDALAAAEPIHPGVLGVLRELGAGRGRVLEVGAGSGRLTVHLGAACEALLALDPSIPLLRLAGPRVPTAFLAAGWAERLPVGDGWADAIVSCSSVGMDAAVITEAERAVRPGGLIAFINPEPGERRGWQVESFDPEEVLLPERDAWIDRLFGAPKPLSDVAWRRR